jgi:hypothetical protein
MGTLLVPAGLASFNTTLYLGGPMTTPTYVAQGRVGNLKFGGVSIDLVDVSNQTATAHRQLATLLKTGDMTFDLFWQPTTDSALFALVVAAPPVLQQWKVTWVLGSTYTVSWYFNGYLSKFAPSADVGKALVAACTIAIDGSISIIGT